MSDKLVSQLSLNITLNMLQSVSCDALKSDLFQYWMSTVKAGVEHFEVCVTLAPEDDDGEHDVTGYLKATWKDAA